MACVNSLAKREQLCKPATFSLHVPESLRCALSLSPLYIHAPPRKGARFQGVCMQDGAGICVRILGTLQGD